MIADKILDDEAHAEGFSSWEKLQDALYKPTGIYQKGTPMARIEFERRRI